MTPVRIGILGTARIVRDKHAPAFAKVEGAVLEAVASRDKDRAQAFAKDLGIPKVHPSYEALIEDEQIDAILNPLPNSLHTEWTIRALEAGKHVLCEKPLALSVEEVDAIREVSARCGAAVLEGFTHRYTPVMEQARAMVANRTFGKPLVARSELSFTLDEWETDVRAQASLGGGALWDCGCYAVSALRFILGAEPVTAYGHSRNRQPNGVDSTFVGQLHFSKDTLCTVTASMEAPYRCTVEVVFEYGRIRIPSFFDGSVLITENTAGGREEFKFPEIDRFKVQLEHFLDVVALRKLSRFPLEDSRANIAALSALQESARTGAVIRVEN